MINGKISIKANLLKTIYYEIQNFTLLDLLLKLTSPALIFFIIKLEKLFIIIFSMLFNVNHHFVFSLSYTKHKYFCIFLLYSNSLADLLMQVYLRIEACTKAKRTRISEDLAH